MAARVVIVGGGQGGYQTAASLRSEGWDGEIILIADEPHLPYQRPPLSKGYLSGKQERQHVFLRPAAFYASHRIELYLREQVTRVDAVLRRVALASGSEIEFDYLVLATGARNRILPVPGADLPGVAYLRSLDEAGQLRERLAQVESLAVIGGGFIGLEVAAVARALGKRVTVIEAQPRLMARAVAPAISEFMRETHAAQEVRIELNASVARIEGVGGATGVTLEDGRRIDADGVVIGVGVAPNCELAAEAGLEVANGIAVDEYLQTSAERIFAIGDAASFPSVHAGARVRLESVQNAADQANAVAKAIAGKPEPYRAAPWFWTDQFDVRMQMAGVCTRADQWVVRGDPAARKFSVFHFVQGNLRAIDSVNRPAEHLLARRLIAARARLTPEQAQDEGFDLKAALQAGAGR
jgi:3-phenylpropionate/trans-cinnamate dioxygenase ferredoxin reductase subunit